VKRVYLVTFGNIKLFKQINTPLILEAGVMVFTMPRIPNIRSIIWVHILVIPIRNNWTITILIHGLDSFPH